MAPPTLLTSLALAVAVLLSPAARAAIDTAEKKPNRLFLWKVTGKTGGTAYLLGSIHVATPDMYPLPKEIDEAFEASKVL